jgi:hypothetical protein
MSCGCVKPARIGSSAVTCSESADFATGCVVGRLSVGCEAQNSPSPARAPDRLLIWSFQHLEFLKRVRGRARKSASGPIWDRLQPVIQRITARARPGGPGLNQRPEVAKENSAGCRDEELPKSARPGGPGLTSDRRSPRKIRQDAEIFREVSAHPAPPASVRRRGQTCSRCRRPKSPAGSSRPPRRPPQRLPPRSSRCGSASSRRCISSG